MIPFIIYICFGVLYAIYDWQTYYNKSQEDDIEKPMVIIHWTYLIFLWPLFAVLNKLIHDKHGNG